jgi:ubiquinone/menaquinone biosynthesis C-methylase UbiE
VRKTDYSLLAEQYAAHRRVNPKVVELLAKTVHRGCRVLEVGCGTGNYLTAVCALSAADGIGVDPSPEMLTAMRARNVPVRTVVGRAEQLSVATGQIDLIYSVDVIHHVTSREAFYCETFRVLRKGGRVCTVTESEMMLRTREPQSRYFPETIDVELARYPSIENLRTEMQRAGFQHLSEDVVEWAYEVVDSTPFREKVFSSLVYISEKAFESGLIRLEAALAGGVVPYVSRYVLLWGTKSTGV